MWQDSPGLFSAGGVFVRCSRTTAQVPTFLLFGSGYRDEMTRQQTLPSPANSVQATNRLKDFQETA